MPTAAPAPLSTNHGPPSASSRAPFSPLPSEIPRTPLNGHFEVLKSHDETLKTPITPPSAYTEFLKNTVSSPAIQSPRLAPPSMGGGKSLIGGLYASAAPTTPYPPPARRVRTPSASNSCSPVESPGTEQEEEEEEAADGPRPLTVKQVVRTTVTFTPRMSLMPAPKGKRRRID